jgi:predicted protein tyrosine phosphatase
MAEDAVKRKVLFVCDMNRLRSVTAERVFREDPRLEVRSAGVDRAATLVLGRELLEWADLVFVMQKRQRNIIRTRFEDLYWSKRIICLYIPDEFELMDPFLVRLLKDKVTPHLGAEHPFRPE